MSADLEDSAVATGLKTVSFHSNPREGQCQRMLKLPHTGAHFICQQGNAQNPSSQVSTVCEPRTCRCTSCIQKRQRNQRSNCQHLLGHRKSNRIPEKHLVSLTMLKPLIVWITTNCGRFSTRPPCLPPEKPVSRSRSNSQNQTWNNGLVQNWESIMSSMSSKSYDFSISHIWMWDLDHKES